MNKRDKCRKL
uniref:Uncharacterized protein n=1 Tax=Arundo donax TaxID=35708 RepID=A0A0A9HFR1_ARUDO